MLIPRHLPRLLAAFIPAAAGLSLAAPLLGAQRACPALAPPSPLEWLPGGIEWSGAAEWSGSGVTPSNASCAPRRAALIGLSLRARATGGAPDPRGIGTAAPGIGQFVHLRAGVEGAVGPLQFRLAPELSYQQNAAYQLLGQADAARDAFSSSFYAGGFSADLPSRFGQGSVARLRPGESSLQWLGRAGALGVTTARPRWGPTVGEGLVLGASAPGVPRLEALVARRTRSGVYRLRWFAGAVRESRYFDGDAGNDRRGLSGARAEFSRRGELVLDAGLSRTVMDGRRRATLPSAAVLPFVSTRSDSIIEIVGADLVARHAKAGSTAWLEVVRQTPFEGVGAFLRMPTEGIAFRTGLSQRLAVQRSATWFATVEFLRLDQSAQRSDRVPNDLYTSAAVAHGWTHEGQPLGSGLGPGGQRQLARLERIGSVWRTAAFLERARWNDDALYREAQPYLDRHDVTLQLGFAAARAVRGMLVTASLQTGGRYNYLFQGASSSPNNRPTDLSLWSVGLSFAPLAQSRVASIVAR